MKKTGIYIFIFVLLTFSSGIKSIYSQTKTDLLKGRKFIQKPVNIKNYKTPQDSLVILNLEKWKSYKLGVLITWGVYTQWGTIDSWTLCSYDAGWNHRIGPYADDYGEYKKQYERIFTYFNPENFDPDLWAVAFKNAGIKYVLAMTKHLDGFCMYNTATTDYRLTSQNCPFHTNPKSNAALEICNSMRKQGLIAGAYFSKSDWYSNYFWWRYFGVKWVDVNYSTSEYPKQWNMYKSLVYNQIDEITKDLGKLDILWLDGGWVLPGTNMDIDMPSIAANVRHNQPGMLIVDRTSGQFEDYLTPEYDIPAEPLGVPWELVTPMGPWWGHVPGVTYYPADSLIHTMVEVFAKGGNILWGLGPDENGVLDPQCYVRLQNIGEWMNINNRAVYGTTYTVPFKSNNVYFTMKQDTVFAIYLALNNQQFIPPQISWGSLAPRQGTDVYLLGYETPLTWSTNSEEVTTVNIPPQVQANPPCNYAWSFKFIKTIKR
ncbi:MAG: alpha-L-fucosidase [Ignavibacteria bacterium]|nr:alpha-L-fucosidase [Ignavibacteria bacterium]